MKLPSSGLMAIALAATLVASAHADAPAAFGVDGHPVDNHTTVRADPPGGALGPTLLHPNAAAGLARTYTGTPVDVASFHYDNLRTGWNQAETDLTPATVASGKFGLLKTLAVDGNVFAQPLLVSGFRFPAKASAEATSPEAAAAGTVHDVLIVATGHNTVFAYDAQTYDVLWQKSLGTPQSSNDVGCSDVVPEYGITSTPVIVRDGPARASIYVVAATEPSPNEFHTMLHKLNLADGSDTIAPVEIKPQATLSDGSTLSFDPKNQWSRAALVWGNNSLYIGIGSHCDNSAGNISGWMLRYGPSLKPMAAFNTVDDPASYKLSSFWGSGFGPAIAANGRVFGVTGNGDFDAHQSGRSYGESVLSLSPSLARVNTSFTPGSYNTLNNEDTDFGSGGVMLLPSLGTGVPDLAVAIGKDSVLYLLNQAALGGLTLNDTGALQALRLSSSGSGVWGGPAFYNSPNGPRVLVQTSNAFLRSYAVSASATPTFSLAASGTSTGGFGGSMPIVSSNGAAPSTGVVWLVRRTHTPQLEAYDATNLGAPIYAATAGTWSSTRNNAYLTAMEGNGRVYVGTYLTVTVFGLTP